MTYFDIAEVNECYLNTHDCHEYATCIDTIGAWTCECNSGFTGDGRTCTDDDECVDGSHNWEATG